MGKKQDDAAKKYDRNASYSPAEALGLVKALAHAGFDETVEAAFNLGIDARQADQIVRGTVTLPHGTGKSVRVLVFADGEKGRDAQAAGADVVGGAELAAAITAGQQALDWDVTIAVPAMMAEVGKLGRLLGPRGLMPNPKAGTVSDDISRTVREFKGGRVEYRNDRYGNVHVVLGKVSFPEEDADPQPGGGGRRAHAQPAGGGQGALHPQAEPVLHHGGGRQGGRQPARRADRADPLRLRLPRGCGGGGRGRRGGPATGVAGEGPSGGAGRRGGAQQLPSQLGGNRRGARPRGRAQARRLQEGDGGTRGPWADPRPATGQEVADPAHRRARVGAGRRPMATRLWKALVGTLSFGATDPPVPDHHRTGGGGLSRGGLPRALPARARPTTPPEAQLTDRRPPAPSGAKGRQATGAGSPGSLWAPAIPVREPLLCEGSPSPNVKETGCHDPRRSRRWPTSRSASSGRRPCSSPSTPA